MATIQYSDLDIKERVGAGGFATVCKGIWKSKNMTVAIKTFPAEIPTTEVWFHPSCTCCLCVRMTLRFHIKVYCTFCSFGSKTIKLSRAQFSAMQVIFTPCVHAREGSKSVKFGA